MSEQPESGPRAGAPAKARRTAAIAAGGAALLLLIGAVGFALAASPSASPAVGASGAPTASSGPSASGGPKRGGPFGLGRGGLGRFGAQAERAFGAIHIAAIDGSKLSLATEDGWTRTITVSGSTTITRAGQTIGLADLQVGDQIVFAETRASDGTFTITRIQVVLPTVVGEVTAKSSDSLTVRRLDGTTETIHVGSGTTYRTRGDQNASLSDVSVGDYVIATGTARSDGSLDAIRVIAGQPSAVQGRGGFGGLLPRLPRLPKGQATPTPAPSGATG